MAKKNNIFLANAFEHYADTHRPYIFGTYGMILTPEILARCASMYPKYLSPARVEYAKEHYIGKHTDDCHGGIKNVAWLPGNDFDAEPIYNASQDITADAAFSMAKEKGEIATLPAIRGICVRYPGHVGVLTDPANKIVTEFRGFDYGCVRTRLNERNWLNWYKHPFFDYLEPEPVPVKTCKPLLPVLNEGSKDTAVKRVQLILNWLGVKDDSGKSLQIDGNMGPKTCQAVRRFKVSRGLYDSAEINTYTWQALIDS